VIYREGPYHFSFFANERNEPPHVHASRDRMEAKFWLEPTVALARAVGFSAIELRRLQRIVEAHRDDFMEAWNGFFGQ
jgi:hypothetical protein